jgi:fibronectin type 3 domain-containing protein
MKKIATIREYKSNTYLDKGDAFTPLDDGRNYFYAITSFNLFDAEGKLSTYVQASTKPRPAAVKGLSASAGTDHIFISWEKNPETYIKSNYVYRNENGGSWSKMQELNLGQTNCKDFELKPERSYGYRIITEDRDGLKSEPADSNAVASPIAKPQKAK